MGVDLALLQQALRHLDQAALALPEDEDEDDKGRAVALAHLAEVRALLTAVAFEHATAQDRTSGDGLERHGTARAAADAEGPALVGRVRLDGDLRAAAAARVFAGSTCATWGVSAHETSIVVDLVSELVSNAARHVGGLVELALERREDHVLVTVHDDSDAPPRLLPYRHGVSEQGIGLRLVDQLSEAWGWQAAADGKDVWARARTGSRAGAGDGTPRPRAATAPPGPRRRTPSSR